MRVLYVNGHKVIIDSEDYPVVSLYKWHIKFDKYKKPSYVNAIVYKNKKRYRLSMHRLLTGMRLTEVDHINRNGLDNRKSNLRFCCSLHVNQYNRMRQNQFNYKGVSYKRKLKKFYARVQIKGKRYESKYFLTPYEAALAYDEMAKKYFGEFAALNFP